MPTLTEHPKSEAMNELHEQSVEELAKQCVTENCSYAYYFRDILFQHEDGVLTMRGRVPSFYMKQILQTLLGDLDGIEKIDNQVDVVSATGLSSVRKPR